MNIIPVDSVDDPWVADYRDIRERDLTGRQGLFVAEGEVVLRTLLSPASRAGAVSVLLDRRRLDGLKDALESLAPQTPVFVADTPVLEAIVGFDLHRGILAIGRKADAADLDTILNEAGPDAVIVFACGIGNHDNMGGILRNAAAFGVDAVLTDTTCCDPFYRKAIRVSVGAALRLPIVERQEALATVDRLEKAEFSCLALSPSAELDLKDVRSTGRTAVLLGAEGPGLPHDLMARCQAVGIPMAGGFDSLNVAATSAIVLHQLARGRSVIT